MKKPTSSQSTTNSQLSSSSSSSFQTNFKSIQELQLLLQKASSLEKKLSSTITTNTTTTTTTTTQQSNTSSSSHLSNNNNKQQQEQQINKIRTELCEKYSDILLSNPQFAYRNDVPNKLWRSCFYSNINELRSRISKDKSRLKKMWSKVHRLDAVTTNSTNLSNKKKKSSSSGSGSSSNGVEQMIQEQEKRIKKSQNALDAFLKDAVRLYEYLVDRLQDMLIEYYHFVDRINNNEEDEDEDDAMDGDDDDNDEDDDESMNDDENEFNRYQSQSQNSTTSNIKKSKQYNRNPSKHEKNHKNNTRQLKQQQQQQQKIIQFVVPSLFRIYIHLGDLHRYSSSYNAAERVYLKASNLAPGKGNPYNQLAVCNQINETTVSSTSTSTAAAVAGTTTTTTTGHPLPAVALYWYCRSLLASHEAFITSKSNLERLFQANKKWIQESSIQTFADVAASNANGVGSGDENNHNINKEQVRVKKSLAKRKFLSKYVDFHGMLLSLLKKLEKDGSISSSRSSGSSSSNTHPNKKDLHDPNKKSDIEKIMMMMTMQKEELIQSMDNLLKEFESILEISAFGDAFLIKMVCINVFSVWNCMEYYTKARKVEARKVVKVEEEERKEGLTGTTASAATTKSHNLMMTTTTAIQPVIIALMFTLRFGVLLCADMIKALEKGIAKQEKQRGKTFGSIRIVGPVFLLCEFISNECHLNDMKEILLESTEACVGGNNGDGQNEIGGKENLSEMFDDTIQEFWRSVANVASVIFENEALMALVESDGIDSVTILPDDFHSLMRGYIPFLSLYKNETEKKKRQDVMNGSNKEDEKEGNQVYISPEEAYDVLELYQSQTQQTQQSQQPSSQLSQPSISKKSSTNCGNDDRTPEKIEMELRIKLKRFTDFVLKHVESGELYKNGSGLITTSQDAVEESMDVCDEEDGIDHGIDMDVEDDEYEDDDVNKFENETQEEEDNDDDDNDDKQNDDVLVYTSAESGKPALLVPGAFLLGEDYENDEKEVESNVKEVSFLSEVTMTAGLEESTSASVPNLLDPSLLMEKSGDGNGDIDNKQKNQEKMMDTTNIGESKLLAVVNRKLSSSAPDLSVLPPPMTKSTQKEPLRPPPGFHSMPKPMDDALPPMPPGLHAPPNDARNPLPPPQVHGFNNRDLPLPQTANPFVSQIGFQSTNVESNDFPLHGHNNFNGLHGSSNHVNTNSFSSFMTPSNPVGMNGIKRNDSEDMNFDYSLIGLHSLGIFTDDKKETEQNNSSVDSLFQPMPTKTQTRNPFVFD